MAQTAQKKAASLTAVDFEYLRLVRMFHFLKVEQIMRLRGVTSKPKVQTRLKSLYDGKYLSRRGLPHIDAGKPEYIYALSTKGINILKDLGFDGFSRFRGDEFQAFAFPHLDHCLAVNDVLIAASLLPSRAPSISLTEMRHDLDLKKTPVRVSVERRLPYGGRTNERVAVIPDGWLDFELLTLGLRRCICFERDMGTLEQKRLRQKFLSYYFFATSSEYQELFGTNLCMVAFAAPSVARMHTLKKWCEQVLIEEDLTHEANLFRFACVPPGCVDPLELFCNSSIWLRPFSDSTTSLLWSV